MFTEYQVYNDIVMYSSMIMNYDDYKIYSYSHILCIERANGTKMALPEMLQTLLLRDTQRNEES